MLPSSAAAMLRIVSIVSFVFALVFASGAFPGFDVASQTLHDFLDFPLDGKIGPYTEEARWFSAIGGGVFAAMTVMFYLIVVPGVARGDREVIRGAVTALIVWFVIDSAGSIAAGVPANAVANVSFLALFLWPLLSSGPFASGATSLGRSASPIQPAVALPPAPRRLRPSH